MIYSISYDLNRAGQNYQDLYETIERANCWAHPMESLWFISTHETVQQWCDRLKAKIDANDSLFVVDITNQARCGWLSNSIWEWIGKIRN
ncbi:MAG: hypothetical protein C4519_11435 [Desulfobacteraceae bacterium]|nr:MAG: hypothetical protein C4519_11435 [Desulfobacteraceae bacterium]